MILPSLKNRYENNHTVSYIKKEKQIELRTQSTLITICSIEGKSTSLKRNKYLRRLGSWTDKDQNRNVSSITILCFPAVI